MSVHMSSHLICIEMRRCQMKCCLLCLCFVTWMLSSVCLYRNHMFVRFRVAPSATRIRVPSANMLKLCMVQRHMSPRNSVVTWFPGLHPHHERTERTKAEPNDLAEEDKTSMRPTAPLEAWRTTCRSSQSKQRTLWYVPFLDPRSIR